MADDTGDGEEGRLDSTYLDEERPTISGPTVYNDDFDEYPDTGPYGSYDDTSDLVNNEEGAYDDTVLPTTEDSSKNTGLTEEGQHILEITLIVVGTIAIFIIVVVVITICCRKKIRSMPNRSLFRKVSVPHVAPKPKSNIRVRFDNSIKRIRSWGGRNQQPTGIEEDVERPMNIYGKHDKKKKKSTADESGHGRADASKGGVPTQHGDYMDFENRARMESENNGGAENPSQQILTCRVAQM